MYQSYSSDMKNSKLLLFFLTLIFSISCQSQTNKDMNKNNKDILMCDPETGTCEIPNLGSEVEPHKIEQSAYNKPIKIIYYTDPICSSCWGIEPQLRKMKLEYGDYIDIDYRMGGLLPDWSYNQGSISSPADVAIHWEEAGFYYEMPIDGGVWLEDPLPSSYPPSIAMKAAQLQDKEKAVIFMRKLRELLFIDKKNITKWAVIKDAANYAGLDFIKLQEEYTEAGTRMFDEDLRYAQILGVRGFPYLFFTDENDNRLVIYGSKPYSVFESTILKLIPNARKKEIRISSYLDLFKHYATLTPKEYAIILDIPISESERILDEGVRKKELKKQTIKTGSIYSISTERK